MKKEKNVSILYAFSVNMDSSLAHIFTTSSHQLIFFFLCDLTLFPSSPDLVFFFHLYPPSWSQVVVTTHSPPPALACRWTWISQLETKMDWQRCGWHWGRSSTQTHGATQADIILFDPSNVTIFQHVSKWEPDNSGPSLPGLIHRVSDLTVSPWESLQWDSTEWYLAWLCLQEVKPYLGPDSNPVFSRIEVQLTASVRERNHAGNLSYWGWTVKERWRREEG